MLPVRVPAWWADQAAPGWAARAGQRQAWLGLWGVASPGIPCSDGCMHTTAMSGQIHVVMWSMQASANSNALTRLTCGFHSQQLLSQVFCCLISYCANIDC